MNKNNALGLAWQLHEVFKKRGLTLSAAESCTGGLISHLITSVPGASLFFKGGTVVYSGMAKVKMLGVDEGLLESAGAVSAETAAQMAANTRALLGTDISVSTTGNLGPDVLEGKELGLVYIGVASGTGEPRVRKINLKGTRQENKEAAAIEAMKFLLEIVEAETFY